MKKIIIRSLIFICISYILISIIVSTYSLINVNQNVEDITLSPDSEIHQEVVSVPTNMKVGDLITLSNNSGKLEIIYLNLKILISSVVIGILLSLTTFLKEESNVKFILIFILGYLIINLFFSLITVYIFQTNGVEISFFERYIDIMKYTFIPYSIIYLILFLLQKYYLKKKVCELNKYVKK